MSVTILDCAMSALNITDKNVEISGGQLYSVGFDIIGGCQDCHATLGCYNGYPSKSGYWRCADCLGDDGFETVAEFEAWQAAFTKES